MIPMAKSVSEADFEAEVLKNDTPVLVDFWAEWCGPCRQVSPILEEISAEHGDKLKIVKVNVDDNPKLQATYQILRIPAMNVYKGGEVVKQIIGAKPKAALLRDLAEFF
jgi:thioredoxin 1